MEIPQSMHLTQYFWDDELDMRNINTSDMTSGTDLL